MYRDELTEAGQVEYAQRNLLHYCYDIPIYESEIAYMQSRKANWFEILTFSQERFRIYSKLGESIVKSCKLI